MLIYVLLLLADNTSEDSNKCNKGKMECHHIFESKKKFENLLQNCFSLHLISCIKDYISETFLTILCYIRLTSNRSVSSFWKHQSKQYYAVHLGGLPEVWIGLLFFQIIINVVIIVHRNCITIPILFTIFLFLLCIINFLLLGYFHSF